MGYRSGSLWSEANEIRCLIAFRRLQEAGFPRGLQIQLCRELSAKTGIPTGSLHAKIGNYKSVAGVIGKSNASKNTREVFEKYGQMPIVDLEQLVR